jgi:hypothetical protein
MALWYDGRTFVGARAWGRSAQTESREPVEESDPVDTYELALGLGVDRKYAHLRT